MDRETLQQKATSLLQKTSRLLCQWATCTGKSNVALKFIKSHPDFNCLILVPEQNNIINWEEEFRKFDVPMNNVQIACYASFHKYKETRWNLIVFDEVPHIDTQLRRVVCNSVHGDYILALGAIVDDDERGALEEAYGPFEISTVTLAQGIQWGIIPKPLICIIHLTLDDKKKNYILRGQRCTAKEVYQSHIDKIDAAKKAYENNPTEEHHQAMLRCGNARKRFLGKIKQDAVYKLCEKLNENHRRFLCFCASIKQANLLGGKNAFTSKTPKTLKTLEKFNEHEIDSLYVVSKLIEGQNLVDIERGIITQLGATPRITVQCIGRILRSKNPIIYIPVFDNTKDDAFLYTVTDNIPEDCIKHYKPNSIF